MDEFRKLNNNFSKLEGDVKIEKNINKLLLQRVVDSERQCWANAEYSRRECLEIAGILCSADDNSLDEKVIQVFKKVGCNIQACHCIAKKNDRVIVKFSRRKDFNKCYQ